MSRYELAVLVLHRLSALGVPAGLVAPVSVLDQPRNAGIEVGRARKHGHIYRASEAGAWRCTTHGQPLIERDGVLECRGCDLRVREAKGVANVAGLREGEAESGAVEPETSQPGGQA